MNVISLVQVHISLNAANPYLLRQMKLSNTIFDLISQDQRIHFYVGFLVSCIYCRACSFSYPLQSLSCKNHRNIILQVYRETFLLSLKQKVTKVVNGKL